MIASWMVHTVVVGMLVSLAAAAAERALLLTKKPVRGVWAAALLLSILIPAVSPRLPWHFTLPSVPALSPIQSVQSVTESAGRIRLREGATAMVVERGWTADMVLLVLWGTSAGGLALFLMYAIGVLQGRRREWRRELLDGVPVLVSRDIGPAVIGWRRLDIVMPEWVKDLEDSARALVLRHEMEHVVRRDPRLLMRTWLGLVAMPWNPALWWQLRRLRRAIELDCDARVVASGADVSRYGRVLLDAVGRCNRGGLPAFAAFAERPGDLEARIRALTAPRPGFWRGRAVMAATAAVMLAAAACLIPDSLAPGLSTQPVSSAAPSEGTLDWVLGQLKGHSSADIVVLYRSHDGRLLGSETLVRPAPGARPERRGPSFMADLGPKEIESIEVIRGPKLTLPGIDGVIVITMKAGTVLVQSVGGHYTHERMQSQRAMLDLATVMAGPRPDSLKGSVTFIWYETNEAGALRGAGYASDKVSLIRRNGKRPAESGALSTHGPGGKLGEIRWARYVAP